MKPNPKKLYVKSFGCQMNVYDGQRLAEVMAQQGYETADSPDQADLMVLNTCHIRDKAAEKVYSEVGRLRALKKNALAKGKNTKIAVTGCVAQAQGELIQKRAPEVDIVAGPQALHLLPKLVKEADQNGRAQPAVAFDGLDKFRKLPKQRQAKNRSAFVSVQEGCDKFCSFCVVPYTRGAEYSRNVDAIEAEISNLVDQGVKEVSLLGQNVNAYHGRLNDEAEDQISLARLIRHLAKIDGLERIRYTTSHPRDMHEELLLAHEDEPKLMPFLHLPVQSGSDRVLKDMNRWHSAEFYIDWIVRLRAKRPDIAVSSDFIVGFPGESDTDFEATMALVREVSFALAFSFKYSPRPGTPGAEREDQIDEAVKAERLARLQSVLNAQQISFNEAQINQKLPVLFEKKGRKTGQIQGRSPYLQAVYCDGAENLIGQTLPVKIMRASQHALSGQLLSASNENNLDLNTNSIA